MSSITGILVNVFVPAFFGRRNVDQTEGGISGKDTHLIIVGTTHVHSGQAAPIPAEVGKEISVTMGSTVAIRIRPEYGRGEVSAHIVPVEWSDQVQAYIVDPDAGRYYRDGGNIAVIDERDARALRAETGLDAITTALPIHDCTK